MNESQSNNVEHSSGASSGPGSTVPFSAAQQIEFIRKELRETLRDRRTIITLMVMPLLLYPLLGFGFRFLALQQSDQTQVQFRLAIETEKEAGWLAQAMQLGDQMLEASTNAGSKPDFQVLLPDDESQFDLESLLSSSAAELGVRVEFDETDLDGSGSVLVQLFENEASSRSREVADYVEKRLAAANVQWIRNLARNRGQEIEIPIRQTRILVEPEDTGSAILGLLPLVLLLMTVTGGVYPAIDLTAGERERNTLETLMALPVPRFRLLAAKYVAVVTVTMLTGLMNLLAMSVTLYALQLDISLLGEGGFTFVLAAKLFLALAVFALFYSAVLLLLTSSARSFKEAQAYLIPLLLLSIAPGLIILMPGWNLAGGTAAIPLVNILLLARELLEGSVQRLPAMVTVISTLFYGASALALAARVFGNDAVAVGSRGRWSDFLQRPREPRHLQSLTLTVTTLALLFPLYFVVSGVLARAANEPVNRLAISAVMTTALFVLVPAALLLWQRVAQIRGLGLNRPAWPFWIAAPLFGLAVWPWVFEAIVVSQGLGIRGFDPDQIENVDSLLAAWQQVPLWVIILCLGVVPGICEEAFFRGFLFRGLNQYMGATAAIVFSAVAFGLFHVVLSGGAAPERILPSTLMGLLLGWIAWRSGSTLPAMILHVVHNTTLLLVVQSRDTIAGWNLGQSEQEHLPLWWLAASAVVLVVASVVVRFSKMYQPVPPSARASASEPDTHEIR